MRTLLAIPAKLVSRLHTALASLAFIVALVAGLLSGIWRDLCTNSVASEDYSSWTDGRTDGIGWPVEWFPSVSATYAPCRALSDIRIGDHPATRAPFHILIALCATPRFLLLALQWLAHRSRSPSQTADLELIIGLARTFSWLVGQRTVLMTADAGCTSLPGTVTVSMNSCGADNSSTRSLHDRLPRSDPAVDASDYSIVLDGGVEA